MPDAPDTTFDFNTNDSAGYILHEFEKRAAGRQMGITTTTDAQAIIAAVRLLASIANSLESIDITLGEINDKTSAL